jgi:hypothetical protein
VAGYRAQYSSDATIGLALSDLAVLEGVFYWSAAAEKNE